MDFTATWHWPQWVVAAWLLLRFIYISAKHGDPRLVDTGPRKGEPERYSGFNAIAEAILVALILTAGGFFV